MDFKIHMLSNVMQLHRSCYAEDISEAKNMQGCLFVCFKKKCSSLRAIGNFVVAKQENILKHLSSH